MTRKLLIATTNKGKFKEIQFGLHSLPFIECVSLLDIDQNIEAPEETESTLVGNALLKVKYYAQKTGLLTLADDTGIFIEELDGWPGVQSAVIAETDEERMGLIFKKMEGKKNRSAVFKAALAVHDPQNNTTFITEAETEGRVLEQPVGEETFIRFGYNRLFYVNAAQKTFAEMDIKEKNGYSHRGKCVQEVRYYLQNQFGIKHIVVPLACIIKDKKILMSLRNDPHNPAFHNKWEFPGGGVEFKETIEENLIREVKEEVGYDVEPVKRLSYMHVRWRETEAYQYQVYLLPYVCKIVGGKKEHTNSETLDSRWFDLNDVLEYDLLADNRQIFAAISDELQTTIKEYNL